MNKLFKTLKDIENIESFGDKVGQYNIQNKIIVTLNNSKNVNISKIKKRFFNKFILWCVWKIFS